MAEERARLRRSLRNFKRLLAIEPGHIGHLEQLARVCVQLERPKDAARYLTDRAGHLMRMGETGAAREDVANALNLHPRYRAAQRLLAKLGEQVSQPRANSPVRVEIVRPESERRQGPLDRDPTPQPTTSLAELEAEALLAHVDPRPEPEPEPEFEVGVDSVDAVDASELLAVRDDVLLEDDIELEDDDVVEDDEDSRPTTTLKRVEPRSDKPTAVLEPVRDERPTEVLAAVLDDRDTLNVAAFPSESMEEALPGGPRIPPRSFELSTADLDAADAYDSIELDSGARGEAYESVETDGHLGAGGPSPVASAETLESVVPRPVDVSPLDGLPESAVDALRASAERRRYEPGERVTIAAARFDGLRLINSGRVNLTLPRQTADTELATRGAGDLLGVVELIRGGRWHQHATTVGATEILHLDPDEVARTREAWPKWEAALQTLARKRLAAALISGAKLFASLPAAQREHVAARFEVRFLQDREALIEPGERADGVFVLAEGRLEVSRDGVHVGGLAPGDCVGLVSALGDAAGEARVVAAPVAEVFWLQSADLEPLLALPDVRAAFERAAQMRRLLVSRR